MTSGVLDVILVLVLVSYAVTGWRSGLVAGALGMIGLVGGGVLAMSLLPTLLDRATVLQGSPMLRAVVVLVAVVMGACIGQAILGTIGRRLRDANRIGALRWVDSLLGSVATVLVVGVAVWFLGNALRPAVPRSATTVIAGSKVLSALDDVMPAQGSALFSSFRNALDIAEFPRVFDGLGPEPITPVTAPDPGVTRTPGITAAAASVVKITSDSTTCRRVQEGSGWVVARHRVVTNAHVVAGSSEVTLRVGGQGRAVPATVVHFDPELDVAVLDAPTLDAPALDRAPSVLPARTSAVVAGFPLDGPYHLSSARVRSTLVATGNDIYGGAGVTRRVYSIYAAVKPGNSGGPLLTTDGRVAGTIFARSLDDASTGYALTDAAIAPILDRAATMSEPVGTGRCANG